MRFYSSSFVGSILPGPPYCLWSSKKLPITAFLYQSQKCLVRPGLQFIWQIVGLECKILWLQSPALHEIGMMVWACHLGILKVETIESEVQVHYQLSIELEASLNYIKPYLKQTTTNNSKKAREMQILPLFFLLYKQETETQRGYITHNFPKSQTYVVL